MPATIHKINGYQVRTPGSIKAKRTTKKKAEAQKRLLNAVDHGWRPSGSKPFTDEEIAQGYRKESLQEVCCDAVEKTG